MAEEKAGQAEGTGRGPRKAALDLTAAELGVAPNDDFPRVFGVVTDWNLGEHTATIVALRDGTANLYTTADFGILGGRAHDQVRRAAIRCVRLAGSFVGDGEAATAFPYPGEGEVAYHLLTYDDGVARIVARESAIQQGEDPTGPLYAGVQGVLTQLRLISERREAAREDEEGQES